MAKSAKHTDNPNIPKGPNGKKTRKWKPQNDEKIRCNVKLFQFTKDSEQVVDPKITLFLGVPQPERAEHKKSAATASWL